jgi:flagellar hook assembly protein FlgD
LTVEVKDVAGNPADAEISFMVEGDALALEKPRNVPNPFRGGDTTIAFGLSQSADVTIRIYDFTARLVATVADGVSTSPSDLVQDFKWDGTASSGEGLANGVYFCQVLVETDSERKSEIIKIALVRD